MKWKLKKMFLDDYKGYSSSVGIGFVSKSYVRVLCTTNEEL